MIVAAVFIIIFSWVFFFSDVNRFEDQITQIQREEIESRVWELQQDEYPIIPYKDDQVLLVSEMYTAPKLLEINVDTNEVENVWPFSIPRFTQFYPSFQQNGEVIFIVKENNDIFLYRYNGELSEIEIPDFQLEAGLHSRVVTYNNATYLIGKLQNQFALLSIHNGQVSVHPIKDLSGIQNITDVQFSFFNGLPIASIATYEEEFYGLSFYYEQDSLQSKLITSVNRVTDFNLLLTIQKASEMVIERMNKLYVISNTNVGMKEFDVPLFYPRIKYLNDETNIIIGLERIEDPSSVKGMIVKPNGELLQSFHIDDENMLLSDTLIVQKTPNAIALISDTAGTYYSDAVHYTYDVADYHTMLVSQITQYEGKVNQLIEEGQKPSIQKMSYYFSQTTDGLNLIIIFFMFVLVIVIVILADLYVTNRNEKRIQRAFARGGEKVNATIVNARMTGVYINELPQVELFIEFQFNGARKRKKFKKLVVAYAPPTIGSRVRVVYDPVKDKVYEV